MDCDVTPSAKSAESPPESRECSVPQPPPVGREWMERLTARISRELELAEEFSRKNIPEAAQRIYQGRASALRFVLGLLDENQDPLAFLKQPIPDRHWPGSFRLRRELSAEFWKQLQSPGNPDPAELHTYPSDSLTSTPPEPHYGPASLKSSLEQ